VFFPGEDKLYMFLLPVGYSVLVDLEHSKQNNLFFSLGTGKSFPFSLIKIESLKQYVPLTSTPYVVKSTALIILTIGSLILLDGHSYIGLLMLRSEEGISRFLLIMAAYRSYDMFLIA
jgi:hypothetical protein